MEQVLWVKAEVRIVKLGSEIQNCNLYLPAFLIHMLDLYFKFCGFVCMADLIGLKVNTADIKVCNF